MKKVYSLVDKHFGEVIASSKTRVALEEMMCDAFMESYWQEMQDAADQHWINVKDPSNDCRQFAQDVWNSLMTWYKSVYDIQRSELI